MDYSVEDDQKEQVNVKRRLCNLQDLCCTKRCRVLENVPKAVCLSSREASRWCR